MYYIPNQQKSSFTIYRRYAVQIYNQWISQLNKTKSKDEQTPYLVDTDIQSRNDLFEFVKNFNKSING
jgi:hypothetical protein